jgi:hypothetical protein
MNIAQAIIHLPGVRLESEGCLIGPGHLEVLNFETWARLDQRFIYSERQFENSRPTFWIVQIQIESGDGLDQIFGKVFQLRWKVHTAFLMEPRVPCLPTPSLSTTYVVLQTNEGSSGNTLKSIHRLVGPAGLEWIVFGGPVSVSYDATDVALVAKEYRLLDHFDETGRHDYLLPAMNVLERTTRPESWWGSENNLHSINEFIHCMAACEGLLKAETSAEDEDSLTDCFGRQAAAAMAVEFEELEVCARYWADTYRLRSRLIHGRMRLSDLDEPQLARLPKARQLLRNVIRTSLAVVEDAKSTRAFSAALARSYSDPRAHEALRKCFGELD